MTDYKKLYFYLFNQITDAIEELDNGHFGEASSLLKKAQQMSEDQWINTETTEKS